MIIKSRLLINSKRWLKKTRISKKILSTCIKRPGLLTRANNVLNAIKNKHIVRVFAKNAMVNILESQKYLDKAEFHNQVIENLRISQIEDNALNAIT